MKKVKGGIIAIVVLVSLLIVMPMEETVRADLRGDIVTAITRTADRLVAMQSTDTLGLKVPADFGWTWVITDETEHNASKSNTKMYGLIALGLLDAYAETGDVSYYNAAKLVADFLKDVLYADTTGGAWWAGIIYGGCSYDGGYSNDYQFLEEFEAVFPGEGGYDTCAEDCWTWQKANIARYATAAAWYTYRVDHTTDDVGQIWCWGSYFALAAKAMGDDTWASDMASEIHSHLADLDGTSVLESRFTGWGTALRLFEAVDPTIYATDINTIIGYIKDDQNTNGSWGIHNGTPTGKAQDTGYVIMGLASVGSAEALDLARQGANWLCANQDYNSIIGGWNEASGNKEYSETDSEALQGLAAVFDRLPTPLVPNIIAAFIPVKNYHLRQANTCLGCIGEHLPEDVPEDVQVLLDEMQEHINNANTTGNSIYANNELLKALKCCEDIQEKLGITCPL